MSTFEDLNNTLDEIEAKVVQLEAMLPCPAPGMTPEQQAALDAAVVTAEDILARLTALVGGSAAPVVAPPQASAAGFTNLVMDEGFSTFAPIDALSYQGDSGVWYNGMGFAEAVPVANMSWAPGALTMTADGTHGFAINTHKRVWPTGNDVGSRKFLHGYFECEFKLNGPYGTPQNWASFWLFSAKHQQAAPDPEEWSEIDIIETGFYPGYAAALHDWHLNGGAFSESPAQSPDPGTWNTSVLPAANLNEYHKFGALWENGSVKYFMDDVLVQQSASNPINDTDPCSVLLSIHHTAGCSATFKRVRVWQ